MVYSGQVFQQSAFQQGFVEPDAKCIPAKWHQTFTINGEDTHQTCEQSNKAAQAEHSKLGCDFVQDWPLYRLALADPFNEGTQDHHETCSLCLLNKRSCEFVAELTARWTGMKTITEIDEKDAPCGCFYHASTDRRDSAPELEGKRIFYNTYFDATEEASDGTRKTYDFRQICEIKRAWQEQHVDLDDLREQPDKWELSRDALTAGLAKAQDQLYAHWERKRKEKKDKKKEEKHQKKLNRQFALDIMSNMGNMAMAR